MKTPITTAKLFAVLIPALLMAICSASQAGVSVEVYSQNFESGLLGTQWSGDATIQSPYGLSVFGFGNWHLKSDSPSACILTLPGLPPHSSMTLSFTLALWDSVDAHQNDLFQVKVDGIFVINEVFGNYVLTNQGQSVGPGVPITPPFTAYYEPDYGYINFRDSARAVSVTLSHSASTAAISFQYPAMQPPPDEAFGIDNIVVTIVCELPADLTGDCFVDMEDFAVFASEWLRDDCIAPEWCGGADFDGSGNVWFDDLKELSTKWLTGVSNL